MKRNKIFIVASVLFLIVFAGAGCSKDFLTKEPISDLSPETFWQDKNDAASWMSGIYVKLQTTLRYNWTDWGEVRSDNFVASGNGSNPRLMGNTLAASDGVSSWSDLYGTISLCNYGIKYYPIMIKEDRDASSTVCKDYLGQCYALRALMYFYGLRVWGKMPLSIEPVESLAQQTQISRSSVEDVKKQILSDIDSALKYISVDATRKYQINKGGVYALQTDVYMWNQDYQNALTASINCETTSGCTLVTNPTEWKNIFLDPVNSKETIFNMYWDNLEFGGGHGYASRFGASGNTNNYRVRTSIYQDLSQRRDANGKALDARWWLVFDTVAYPAAALYTGAVAAGKFMPWDANATGIVAGTKGNFVYQSTAECNVRMPIYRFADVILLRAEALAHLGQHQAALDIVNRIRARVGYNLTAKLTDYTGDLLTGIERTILAERQLEFLFEGKRWFDLCRIGKLQFDNNGYWYLREVMNPLLTGTGKVLFDNNSSVPQGMNRILFPISSDAFNANPKLRGDQNLPYDE